MEIGNFTLELDKRKRHTPEGVDYWMARDIQRFLGYDTYQNFESAIERAKEACRSMGSDPAVWFSKVNKPTISGRGKKEDRWDYYLTRLACYLIAMNGDPRKPEIAMAQAYFAIQTRRQEKRDELTEAEKRAELREQIRIANKQLYGTAKNAGVHNYGIFYDGGYSGMYDMGKKAMFAKRGLGKNEDLYDRINITELAANQFRITQCDERIKRKNVKGEKAATQEHYLVGREVRNTIEKLENTMPENLPLAPPLKKALREEKKRMLKP